MKFLLPFAAAATLLLSACGSDAGPDAAATVAGGSGELDETECRVIADRITDAAKRAMPDPNDAAAAQFLKMAADGQVEACLQGGSWTRADFECVKAAATPDAFDSCMENSANRAD